MNFRYSLVFLYAILLTSIDLNASHLVGGYFNYTFMDTVGTDSARYEIEFRMFRDCLNGSPGAQLEDTVPITVFHSNNPFPGRANFLRISLAMVPDDFNDPCLVQIDNVCVEEAIYRDTLTFSRGADVQLVFQRCCRNNIIDNIIDPEDQGNTFLIDIPAFDRVGINSSPRFDAQILPFMLCAQADIRNLDLSATDLDTIFELNGDTILDSLAYSFCAPLNYMAVGGNPRPVPAFPPPYNEIIFQSPQAANNPIPSNPFVRIDPQTGIISGRPSNLGNYVIGICIEEYRRGVLLTRTIRDIQITTGNCNPVIVTTVQDQEQFCNGLEVQFKNNTTSPTPGVNVNNFKYKWDFGDLTVMNDTSREIEPKYTYDSPGIYTITLITNPGLNCSDTSTNQFEVLDKLDPLVEMAGNFCVDANEIDFFVGGQFENRVTFEWDFGSAASIQQSTMDSIFDVQFTGNGPFPIQLRAFQDNCSVIIDSTITLIDNPVVDFLIEDTIGCPPHTANFIDQSTFTGNAQFFWDVGDNNTILNDRNSTHTYQDIGSYNVGLLIITEDGCIGQKGVDNAVRVEEGPTAMLEEMPATLSFKEAVINIDGSQSLLADSFLLKVDNEFVANTDLLRYQFRDTGNHVVELIVFNEFECSDTTQREVFVFDEFEFIIPNVFTPNRDGINDEFKVYACGVYGYEILIFNRFGEKVFESNSLNISWDGRFRGRLANSGTYFYTIKVLDFMNEYRNFQGTVTLLTD